MVHCGAPRCGVVYGDFGTVPIWSFGTVRCEAKYQTVARLGALNARVIQLSTRESIAAKFEASNTIKETYCFLKVLFVFRVRENFSIYTINIKINQGKI